MAESIDNFDPSNIGGELEDPVDNPADNPLDNDNPSGSSSSVSDSIIDDLLKSQGISDKSAIKFENDDNTISTRHWEDLTYEEKMNILHTNNQEEDLHDDEIELLNSIRNSKMTPTEYLEAVKNEAYNTALSENPTEPTEKYEVDNMSDDELFVFDTLSKLGEDNITDEELEDLLNKSKENEALHTKTIESLRNFYKQKEDELKLQEQEEIQAQQAKEYEEFQNSVLNEIMSLSTMGNLAINLNTDEKNELANFILTKDQTNSTEFGKIIEDPKQFVKLAFWALKGNDIVSEMQNQIKAAYDKGLNDGKKRPQVVVTNPNTNQNFNFNGSAAFRDV